MAAKVSATSAVISALFRVGVGVDGFLRRLLEVGAAVWQQGRGLDGVPVLHQQVADLVALFGLERHGTTNRVVGPVRLEEGLGRKLFGDGDLTSGRKSRLIGVSGLHWEFHAYRVLTVHVGFNLVATRLQGWQ